MRGDVFRIAHGMLCRGLSNDGENDVHEACDSFLYPIGRLFDSTYLARMSLVCFMDHYPHKLHV